jgi:signal transduction histidine kinase
VTVNGTDAAQITVAAAVAAIGVSGLGLVLLRLSRRRSVAVSVAVVALTPVVTVTAAAVAGSMTMFLSSDQLGVVVLAAVIAGVAGVPVATAMARSQLRFQQLTDSRERELAIEASRRELVAGVTHDLRTPLAGIQAMAEALEDGVAGDPQTIARYHLGIRTETDRLAGMVDELFELSRIQAGALHLTMQRVALADLVDDALVSIAPVARAKGVRVAARAQPGMPVDVDASELGRALRNLLANAVRHTPSDGTIEVHSAEQGAVAHVTISDACGGIPEPDLPRVFDVGFRGSTARTPAPDAGAGLGLAIARGIVEAHAGQISVENTAGGCQFVVVLPLAGKPPSAVIAT